MEGQVLQEGYIGKKEIPGLGTVLIWGRKERPPYPSVELLKPQHTVIVDGHFLLRRGSQRTMGLRPEDLEQLIYDLEEIPGWITAPPPESMHKKIYGLQGVHTIINLDDFGYVGLKPVPGGMRCRILRIWRDLTQLSEYNQGRRNSQELKAIEIEVRVYDRPAKEHGETLSEYRWQSQAGMRMKEGTLSGFPLGEESWYLEPTTLFFRINRCVVIVRAPDLWLSEALAWGIEYRIQQHPKMLGMAQKPVTLLVANKPFGQGKVISLAGVIVAPLSTLEPAQVVLETKRTKMEWMVTARRNGQWVKVKAFSWEMETDKGKVKLERPVFPYKGELVVPLRQVAEALGISVQQKGQTIALLPK
jgi:hypothetical protein